jgi:hypothetical protein
MHKPGTIRKGGLDAWGDACDIVRSLGMWSR